MRIVIEGYRYVANDVKDVLWGIDALENVEGYVTINYVGYYYNPHIQDCVFFLPKVLLEVDEFRQEKVFGKHLPKELLNLNVSNPLSENEERFIYEFAVWIYRAIVVFKQANPSSDIVYHKQIARVGKGRKRINNTFLDILLSLIQFNKDNQNFFFFILRNLHSGFNKINWNRTISTTTAVIQDGCPVYINPVNKKRQINFDEELLVIFFSILNYIGDHYGFPKNINCNFELITGRQFEKYLHHKYGRTRLLQIKYKYFSDKALELWHLCFAFFDNAHKIVVNTEQKEYLLVKNFNVVFEAIIDELVGTPHDNIPKGLADQEDGKRVDHLYTYRGLTNNEEDTPIYYIGDSKYYKRGNAIDDKSVYKQFTYARNVIQWNLNLFMNEDTGDEDWLYDKLHFSNVPILRDEITEGYNIIPNFFISARLNEALSYDDAITPTDKAENQFHNRHFNNRLFDRDTLLVCHYDVNFLYVVALFARNNALQKKAWQKKVRDVFRTEIQKMLEDKYTFYAMTPREGVNAEEFLKENFQQLLGKVYTPYHIEDQSYYSLALDTSDPKYDDENDLVLALLEPGFYYNTCPLGEDPRNVLPKVIHPTPTLVSASYLTTHFVERYPSQHFLIGCYHSQEQYDWILGKNDRKTNLYNVRLKRRGSTARDGSMAPTVLKGMDVKFVVLYKEGEENKNNYRVFHIHHHATMDEERMRKALYPNPKGNYYCFVFDEEVKLAKDIDISKIIADAKMQTDYVDYMPIFLNGSELINYTRP